MTDFHIHTSLCDGANSPTEMAEEAYKKGFTALGFSGHSYIPTHDYCMTVENTAEYIKEITSLKAKYDGKMDIFCGIEQDYFSNMPTADYDYVIGSVHSLSEKLSDSVDASPQDTTRIITEQFNGDFIKYSKAYYSLVADLINKTNCDIIGHFDLITKFKDALGYDECKAYFNVAFEALDSLLKFDRIFEINVGAMTRNYRTTPYPSVPILKRLNEKGAKIMINGDCHNKLFLGQYLNDAKLLAKECGFKSHFILTKNGFKEIAI